MSRPGSPLVKSCKQTLGLAHPGRRPCAKQGSSSDWTDIESTASLTGYEGESDSDNLPPSPQPKGLRRRAAVRPPKSAVPVRKRQRRCLSQSPPVASVAPAPSQPDNKENEVSLEDKGSPEIARKASRPQPFKLQPQHLRAGASDRSASIFPIKTGQEECPFDFTFPAESNQKGNFDRRRTNIAISSPVDQRDTQGFRLSWGISDIEGNAEISRQPSSSGGNVSQGRANNLQGHREDENKHTCPTQAQSKKTRFASFTSSKNLKARKNSQTTKMQGSWADNLSSADAAIKSGIEASLTETDKGPSKGRVNKPTTDDVKAAAAGRKPVQVPAFTTPKVAAIRTSGSGPRKVVPRLEATAGSSHDEEPSSSVVKRREKRRSGLEAGGATVEPPSPDKDKRSTRAKEQNRKSEHVITIDDASDSSTPHNDVLCEYPEKGDSSIKRITVCKMDYESLEEGEFLNDVIIDFVLTHLHQEVLNVEDRPFVHVFKTQFYQRITTKSKSEDMTLSPEERRYKRVERWTKNIDLFSKSMVIFPICLEAHWFLIIAVKPGLIKEPRNPDDQHIKGEPFLILLDSMGGTKTQAVKIIREYLTHEWFVKKGGNENFSTRNVRLLKPEKPNQDNFTDCGVYLLQYVEMIFGSIAQFYWPKLPDLREWFPEELILRKRFEIATHIQMLAKTQNGINDFPRIALNDDGSNQPNRRSKRTRRPALAIGCDDVFEPELEPPPVRRSKRSPTAVVVPAKVAAAEAALRRRGEKNQSNRLAGRAKRNKTKESGPEEIKEVPLFEDQRLVGDFKIPKRAKLRLTLHSRDGSEDDKVTEESLELNKETEERVSCSDARAGLGAAVKAPGLTFTGFYGKVDSSNKSVDKSDSEGFKDYLKRRERSKSPKKTDKEMFRNFLEKKERDSSASITSAMRSQPDSPSNSVVIEDEPEVIEDQNKGKSKFCEKNKPRRRKQSSSVLLESPQVVGEVLNLTQDDDDNNSASSRDSIRCQKGDSPPFYPVTTTTQKASDKQSSKGRIVVKKGSASASRLKHEGSRSSSKRNAAERKASVLTETVDSDVEEIDQTEYVNTTPSRTKPGKSEANVPLVNVESSPPSAALLAVRKIISSSLSPAQELPRKKETAESKVNRLGVGYSASKYRLYSGSTSSMETSSEFWTSQHTKGKHDDNS